ncbi:kinase-like protein [Gigaspora margarita]|uniref:mitogen-activated protein kinase kinase n=1 Tax=Gigaspora margarita TaxID=4874 RepID=A0A8H4A7Q8_GIGMA|nr:kinase-like protein [Gigaspora margarita]
MANTSEEWLKKGVTDVTDRQMPNDSEEWLKKAVSDGHINYFEYEQFTNGIIIGEGGFGTVYKYEWKNCNLTVALKRLKVKPDKNIIKHFISELKILKSACSHSNIIEFYGITKDSEYCDCMIFIQKIF